MTKDQERALLEAVCPLCGGPAYYTETVNGSSMAYVGCARFAAALLRAEARGISYTLAQSITKRAMDRERRLEAEATELEKGARNG